MSGDEDLLPDEEDWFSWGFPPPPPAPPGLDCDLLLSCPLEWGTPGAHLHRAHLPLLPIVAVCSSVLLVGIFVTAFLLWRHKRKVQSEPPIKPEETAPSYGDTLLNRRPPGMGPLMPLEILDVKLSTMGPQLPTLPHPPFYPPRDAGHPIGGTSPNPVYEEVSPSLVHNIPPGQGLRTHDLHNETDMTREDSGQCSATSSVRGSTGGDLSRDPVSSDDDDEYKGDMLPCDDSFGFPHKLSRSRPRNSRGGQKNLSHRTAVEPDHGINGEVHPQQNFPPQTDRAYPYCRGHSAGHWSNKQDGQINYPSQENIYSTIDEDEQQAYHPSPSLVAAQQGFPGMLNSAKRVPLPADRHIPPLSQRSKKENCNSYGDMLPAYGSSVFL